MTITLPFTLGQWQDTHPVPVQLEEGENTLHFSRNNPPQYGVAVRSFTLTPQD